MVHILHTHLMILYILLYSACLEVSDNSDGCAVFVRRSKLAVVSVEVFICHALLCKLCIVSLSVLYTYICRVYTQCILYTSYTLYTPHLTHLYLTYNTYTYPSYLYAPHRP